MRLHPFEEVATNAFLQHRKGATIYQQFLCAHCGVKQTMGDPNIFYERGTCEECGKETNIRADGCNFMATWSMKIAKD